MHATGNFIKLTVSVKTNIVNVNMYQLVKCPHSYLGIIILPFLLNVDIVLLPDKMTKC